MRKAVEEIIRATDSQRGARQVIQSKIKSPCVAILTGFLWLLVCGAPPAEGAIHYQVSIAHPEQHLFHVSMEVPEVHGEVKLQMAAWNALYEIRDFSSHVQQVEAYADGKQLPIEKLDKLTWRVKGTGTVIVRYATFWDDPGPFNTQLSEEHAFINAAMILLYVEDRRTEKSVMKLTDVPPGWRVASAALVNSEDKAGNHQFTAEAASYDALIDAPVEASKFEEFTIHDLTPPVHVVVHGDGWKRHEVESALHKICAYEVRLMDGAPYEQYTFIFHIGKAANGSGGGMEHANSTAIYVQSDAFLPNVSAHEFFHLWNVKRIRPATLEPVDYTQEMYTRALWFAEGVTNTVGSYTLVRTGLWNKQEFYQDLSAQISELESRPAEKWQSAEQSSLDAWLEKYALYNQPVRSVSYYTKGQVLGVLLDILLRDRTDNQKSLDDVLRGMNQDFAKEGKFYRDSLDVQITTEKVSGVAVRDFFAKYVSAAEPLPYAELLARAGLELHTQETVRATLGFVVERDTDGQTALASVEAESGAAKAGLHTGDVILRWNKGDVPKRVERWVRQQKPGDEVHLRVRSGETEKDVTLRLGESREKSYQVAEAGNADERARHIREGMLKGTINPVTAKKR